MAEHAVIVTFEYGLKDLDALFAVEDQLEAAIEQTGVGEYDGNEIAADGSEGTLYMYGPDADALFEAVKDVLRNATCLSIAAATLRYGPPDEGTRRVSVQVRS